MVLQEVDASTVVIKFKRVVSRRYSWLLSTKPNCQYQLLRITRTIELTPGTWNTKVFKYGLSEEARRLAKIRLDAEGPQIVILPHRLHCYYVENFKDFGEVYYEYSKTADEKVFERFLSNTFIPKDIELTLPMFKNSDLIAKSVTLIVEPTTETKCEMRVFRDGEERTRVKTTKDKSFVIKTFLTSRGWRIKYRPVSLEDEHFFLTSTCNLKVVRLKVNLQMSQAPLVGYRHFLSFQDPPTVTTNEV